METDPITDDDLRHLILRHLLRCEGHKSSLYEIYKVLNPVAAVRSPKQLMAEMEKRNLVKRLFTDTNEAIDESRGYMGKGLFYEITDLGHKEFAKPTEKAFQESSIDVNKLLIADLIARDKRENKIFWKGATVAIIAALVGGLVGALPQIVELVQNKPQNIKEDSPAFRRDTLYLAYPTKNQDTALVRIVKRPKSTSTKK